MSVPSITLSEHVNRWLQEQMKAGGFTDASSYVEDLIRQDRERAEAAERLQAMITEGLESGISDLQVEEILERVKAEGANG